MSVKFPPNFNGKFVLGFRISWIACAAKSKESLLAKADLRETEIPDELNETPFSGAAFPGGWYILFSNDYGFVSSSRLTAISENSRIVACQVHETVMVSAAYCYENGEPVWEVTHDSEKGMYDLSFSGDMPDEFKSIRQRLIKEQDDDGGESSDVDFTFDIPVETAASICGFRYDQGSYDWGEPAFTRLDPPPRSFRLWPFGKKEKSAQ